MLKHTLVKRPWKRLSHRGLARDAVLQRSELEGVVDHDLGIAGLLLLASDEDKLVQGSLGGIAFNFQ